MSCHDPFGEPGRGGKNVSNRIYQVGGAAGTKQRHGIPVYFRYTHHILGMFNKVRISVKVGGDIAHAVCLQLVKGLVRPPRINLPESGRQILDQFTVSLLARLQFPGRAIVICGALDRYNHGAGRLWLSSMPCTDDGIAHGSA